MSLHTTYDLFTDNAYDRKHIDGVHVIPLSVTFGRTDFPTTAPVEEFYELLKTSAATTSAVNTQQVYDYLRPSLEEGRDVVYFTITSGLSSTFDHALTAATILRKHYPDRRIECVDSNCISGGQGLLVSKLAELKNAGASIDDLLSFASTYWDNVIHLFTVDDLLYLRRGGRIGRVAYGFGSVFGVVPVMHFSTECSLDSLKKVRGSKNSHRIMAEMVVATKPTTGGSIYIHHANCESKALAVAAELNALLPGMPIIHGPDMRIGPVIGTHTGPGTMAIFYFAEKQRSILVP